MGAGKVVGCFCSAGALRNFPDVWYLRQCCGHTVAQTRGLLERRPRHSSHVHNEMSFAESGEKFAAQKWNHQNSGEYKRCNTSDNRFGVFLDLSEQAFVPAFEPTYYWRIFRPQFAPRQKDHG